MSGTQVVVRAGHRIAKHLLVVGKAKREMLEKLRMQCARKGRLVHQTTPRRVSRIERHDLGQKLLPYRGANAVRADQYIALLRRTIGEVRDDVPLVLLDAAQLL